MWALQPCLNCAPGRWAQQSPLCTPLPELGEGRDRKHLKSEGNKVERGRGGRARLGSAEGREEERKERGRERLGALPAVLQAKGFIEHNMPRNKRE